MKLSSASLKNSIFANLLRRLYYRYRFQGLFFDVWRYLENRSAKKLYRQAGAQMVPSPLEQKVIRDLSETGISVVHLNDLLSEQTFGEVEKWAEAEIRKSEVQQKIKETELGGEKLFRGGWSGAKSDKFYIVRPIGDFPVVDVNDIIMRISLSEPVLRIVCGYLGMFARLTAVDLWYNIATDGPDVFSQRWHRDPEDRSIVKVFLYLRDVHETDGPFCYVPNTHKPWALTQKIGGLNYPKDGVVDRKFPPNRRQMCTGKAGTMIFCDTTGFHKGGHPVEGARFVFNAVYASNASQPCSIGFRQFSVLSRSVNLQNSAALYAIGLAILG